MNKKGPIIIIEDDMDDQDVLTEIFSKLGYENQVCFFTDGNNALEYINKDDVHPFLILSDINMPKINGFELRNKVFIDEKLHTKCIPYLFFTTSSTRRAVMEAYALSVQGFFTKPSTVQGVENTIKKIIEYWMECVAPGDI